MDDERTRSIFKQNANKSGFVFSADFVRAFSILVAMTLCMFSSLDVSAQLVGHERWSGKDYYVAELVYGRTIEVGAVLKLVDAETGEIFDTEVLAVSNVGVDLELEVYRVDHNLHFFLEVPINGISAIQR
jgi:hypothetical protein|tara:strand:+ start:459 stop:848 length:390 start_codon:yes stop_codon:yes gene_type:complete